MIKAQHRSVRITKKGNTQWLKKAVIAENKGCATCSIGAVCLVDGPIPDFEIGGVTGLFGLWGISSPKGHSLSAMSFLSNYSF